MIAKLVVAFVCLSACAHARVTLQIHATAGCTDTVWFLQNQLLPALDLYGQYLDLEFVPWGRTTRSTNGDLSCQFGVADCWANRVQRCALDLLPNQESKVSYLACEYAANTNRPAFLLGSYACAFASGINIISLDHCVAWSGDHLDAASEERAQQPMQIINFVPALVVNDVIDVDLHWDIFYNLINVVCNALLQDPDVPVQSC